MLVGPRFAQSRRGPTPERNRFPTAEGSHSFALRRSSFDVAQDDPEAVEGSKTRTRSPTVDQFQRLHGRQYTPSIPPMRASRISQVRLAAWLAMSFVLSLPAEPRAHDIPADVTVQAFVKPEGQRLRLIVRVPLKAMRDVNFPTRGPGFLDLSRADATLRSAAILWLRDSLALYEDDKPLGPPAMVAVRASLPSDRSFTSFDDAIAHVTGARLPDDSDLVWDQALLDVLFEYPIRSDRSRFSVHPGLARLGVRVVTVLRFLPPGGAVRAFEYVGDPGLIRLDPRWHQAAWHFVKEIGRAHV